MDEQSDAALVAAALAGQRQAFVVLVRRYQDYAYGRAIGMLSDFDLARDVVQEAFLCAYRDLPKLKDHDRFAGWLHGIVRNMARRMLREVRKIRALAQEMQHRVKPTPAVPLPDESAEDAFAGPFFDRY